MLYSMCVDCRDYDFESIEPFWQKIWRENKLFKVNEGGEKPKYYILDMFPYPSGTGLHMGHPEGYTASDIVARYKKAQGYNVLHPMGWDAFGLPAEQHALSTGVHPAINTKNNIENFKKQLNRLGFAIDWDREINTTDPDYYKWTQWIFLQLLKHGLAYVTEKPVWWCEALGTVLANEEVIDGRSERGNHPVERRQLRQWVLKITASAEKLLETLPDLGWPTSTKKQQTLWIGKSVGAKVDFEVEGSNEKIEVFTTRADTLFGVSYLAIAPEHQLLSSLTKESKRNEVEDYLKKVSSKSDLERTELAKEKSGVFTGSYAINPINGEAVPIWVADYVLVSYGKGAVMAVPAHDERDFDFASKFNLPIKTVIENPKDKTVLPYTQEGITVNSGNYSGLDSKQAQKSIIEHLSSTGKGKLEIQFKLHDWLFSRQRYWGEPFPVLWINEADYNQFKQLEDSPFKEFAPKNPVVYERDGLRKYALPLASKDLPLKLPDVRSYKPSGSCVSPLSNAEEGWLEVYINLKTGEIVSASGEIPDGEFWVQGVRETNTMPQWAGSCWYYLRYMSPNAKEALVSKEAENYWKTPDLYIGGAEHAVLHLLYARFWHRFLFDIGVVSEKEPFKKLFHPGIILGEDGNKMSKSRGNVVNPDDIIDQYGADTLRLYIMFLGPLEAKKPWSLQNIEGIYRFLKKVWKEYVDEEGKISSKLVDQVGQEDSEFESLLHQTIRKVTQDIEELRLNTAISQMMILVNHMQKLDGVSISNAKIFLQLLAPFAPHIAEEIWSRLGEKESIIFAKWPTADETKMVENKFTVVVQVNARLRGELQVDSSISKEELMVLAKEHPKVAAHLSNCKIIKEIYVPKKLINFVVR